MNDWTKWLIAAVFSLLAAVSAVQWQQAESEARENSNNIEQMEKTHKSDVARLDESMRTRRNQIADLEERIAVLEERTK